ncbi:MAG TPA: outer membrane protein assembly factor BamD [Candidatus Saccharimonadales bacterium]|nr:outer membrane protein assembly factor BamD [Candidatus Saccharimonadales bacterium]
MTLRARRATVLVTLLFLAGCGGTLKESRKEGRADFPGAKTAYDRGNYLDAIPDFKAFIEQYPGTDRTDDALYYLGLSYIKEKDYALASAQFDRLLRDFPTSPLQPDALYEQARCDDLQSHPALLDQTETERALARYNQFVDQYPEHARVPDAKARIQVLRDRLAEKLLRSGRLYAKLGREKAAEFYLRRLLTEYPDSKWVKEASQLLTAVIEKQGRKREVIDTRKDGAVPPETPRPKDDPSLPGNQASEAPG